MNLYSAVVKHDFAETTCFLCGAAGLIQGNTREHVFPKWLLHHFELWDKHVDLINETPIPYRNLVIPCCSTCNNEHLSKIEDLVQRNFLAGAKALQSMDRACLMLWTMKIFYGLLYREIFLPIDRRNPQAGNIVSAAEDMEQLQLLHYILQGSRVPMRFSTMQSDIPASLFVFDLLVPDEKANFDYRDDFMGRSLYLRMGEIGILACFDMGAQTVEGEDFFPSFQNHKLHQVQFEELGANMFLKARKLNRVPKVAFSEGSQGVTFTVFPLGGLSTKPVFDTHDAGEMVDMLVSFWGRPREAVMPEQGRRITLLRNSDGTIRHFQPD